MGKTGCDSHPAGMGCRRDFFIQEWGMMNGSGAHERGAAKKTEYFIPEKRSKIFI
jgi:hypothetical protein